MTRPLLVAGLLAAVVLALLACPPQNLPQAVPPAPSPQPGFEPPPEPGPGPGSGTGAGSAIGGTGAAGAACTAAADCASGICEGEGCGAGQGVCAAAKRSCTLDLRPYCGCDGITFDASGSCPERRFARRGACQAAATPAPAGSACLLSSDCESGVCEGKGCGGDTPGTCAAKSRGCTRDRRTYCGCDGVTFYASGSCPGKRYRDTAACPAK